MRSPYRYFKLLFSDDEQLKAKWNQLSEGKAFGKIREAISKELQRREYRYEGVKWTESSG